MYRTLLSWMALLAIAAAFTWRYDPQFLRRWRQSKLPAVESKPAAKKSKRTHLTRVEGEGKGTSTPTSSNEAPVSKKRKIVSAPIQDTVNITTITRGKATISRDDDGEMSNRDFAQQLSKAQAGTKLERTSGPQARSRTVKQSNAFDSPSLSGETSSTGGRDGDDDMSPVGSPPSGPVSTAPTSRAGDISDMLEPQAAKPTTLRLTDTQEKTKPKPQPKRTEEALTKKQRQRQKENERRQQMQLEGDRQHNAKKENQIRGARMAEGTSNQTKANSFAPTQNVWKMSESSTSSHPTTLLDTFDPADQTNREAVTTQPSSKITNGVNVTAAKEKLGAEQVDALSASTRERPDLAREASWADEVNEEEQDRYLRDLQQEEAWEPVTNKKGRKTRKETDTSSENSSRPKQRSVANGKAESLNRFQSMERLGGSDWEA